MLGWVNAVAVQEFHRGRREGDGGRWSRRHVGPSGSAGACRPGAGAAPCPASATIPSGLARPPAVRGLTVRMLPIIRGSLEIGRVDAERGRPGGSKRGIVRKNAVAFKVSNRGCNSGSQTLLKRLEFGIDRTYVPGSLLGFGLQRRGAFRWTAVLRISARNRAVTAATSLRLFRQRLNGRAGVQRAIDTLGGYRI